MSLVSEGSMAAVALVALVALLVQSASGQAVVANSNPALHTGIASAGAIKVGYNGQQPVANVGKQGITDLNENYVGETKEGGSPATILKGSDSAARDAKKIADAIKKAKEGGRKQYARQVARMALEEKGKNRRRREQERDRKQKLVKSKASLALKRHKLKVHVDDRKKAAARELTEMDQRTKRLEKLGMLDAARRTAAAQADVEVRRREFNKMAKLALAAAAEKQRKQRHADRRAAKEAARKLSVQEEQQKAEIRADRKRSRHVQKAHRHAHDKWQHAEKRRKRQRQRVLLDKEKRLKRNDQERYHKMKKDD